MSEILPASLDLILQETHLTTKQEDGISHQGIREENSPFYSSFSVCISAKRPTCARMERSDRQIYAIISTQTGLHTKNVPHKACSAEQEKTSGYNHPELR